MATANANGTRRLEIKLGNPGGSRERIMDDPRKRRIFLASCELLQQHMEAAMQVSDFPKEPIEMTPIDQVRWQGNVGKIPIKIRRMEPDENWMHVTIKPAIADNAGVWSYLVKGVPPLVLRKFFIYLDAPVDSREQEDDDVVTPESITKYIAELKAPADMYRQLQQKVANAKADVTAAEEALVNAQLELEKVEKEASHFHEEHLRPKLAEINKLQSALADLAAISVPQL